jgi:DNA-binding response OmpR family regulator
MQAVIVAQDNDLNDYLAYMLRRSGFEVNFRASLQALVKDWNERPADLILWDATAEKTPNKAIGELRQTSPVYLMILNEDKGEERDAAFLQAGADLVLHLPIGPKLLLANIESFLRRSHSTGTTLLPLIKLGNISLNPSSRTVEVVDQPARTLTQLEFRLLHLLMTHPGQVMPPDVVKAAARSWCGD